MKRKRMPLIILAAALIIFAVLGACGTFHTTNWQAADALDRAFAAYQAGNHNLALEEYNEAVRLDPNSSSTLNARGIMYYQLGFHDLAILDFNRVIQLYPGDWFAFGNRALAYEQIGDYHSAIADRTRLLNPAGQATRYNTPPNVSERIRQEDLPRLERLAAARQDEASAFDPSLARQQGAELSGTYSYSPDISITFSGFDYTLITPNEMPYTGWYTVAGNLFLLQGHGSTTNWIRGLWTVVDPNTIRDSGGDLWMRD